MYAIGCVLGDLFIMNRTDKEEYVFGSILLLANKLQIWGDNMIDDLTMKQWFLLLLISKMGILNPTVKEVADFTGTSRQNVKKMLEQLEKKEYVSIDKSKKDARALNVTLSRKTFEYFIANEKRGAEAVHDLFSEITDDELSVTNRTLEKLLIVLGNHFWRN